MGTKRSLVIIIILFVVGAGRAALADALPGGAFEVRFKLPQVKGNPFDYTVNDVEVTFSTPAGDEVTVPAFFDGDITWAARHMPDRVGHYIVRAITLNGSDAKAQSLSSEAFDVTEHSGPGFIRIDPNHKMRFSFDDGSPYYPVGYDLAWRSEGPIQMPPLTESLDRMGRAGVNWSRIWMDYWDGKNLDWPQHDQPPRDQSPRDQTARDQTARDQTARDQTARDQTARDQTGLEIGQLLLPVAVKWDEIVSAAARNHVYFQMVLQHHGQYSSTTNSNWTQNPWNKANGGWLDRPEQFFTDARALQLTRNKFRYIIARWAYSPAIMAFELFNEVESTDGYKKDLPSVAAWHESMAAFIRKHDRYRHLITSSSHTDEPAIWPAMDYYQSHAYPSDLIAAINGLDEQKLNRPYFYGEIGGSSSAPPVPTQQLLHKILWASLMSDAAGTAEYWYWYEVEPQNLLGEFTQVQEFIRQSGLLKNDHLHAARFDVHTPESGPLQFGPGQDWATSKAVEFTVLRNGLVKDLGGMSAFLQGTGENHAMFPSATFNVDYPQAGTFAVEVSQTTRTGAKLEASIDQRPAAALTIAGRSTVAEAPDRQPRERQNIQLDASLEIPVAAGPHTIRLENSGENWVQISQFKLTPYAPQLAVLGKASEDSAVLWVYRRSLGGSAEAPIEGDLIVPELVAGTYQVTWWDNNDEKVIRQDRVTKEAGKPVTLKTPPINRDAACWITRAGG